MERIIKAFFYSVDGIKATFKTEPAFRQELYLCIILVPLAIMLDVSVTAKILMLGSLFLVLITELANTAIEVIVDYISLEKHPMAKKAKDIGSSIVFIALLNVVIVWGIVLFA